MPLRTVHVKIRRHNQVIDERDVLLDPRDDAAVRAALADTLAALNVDPTPDHSITLYKPSGDWIRKLNAA